MGIWLLKDCVGDIPKNCRLMGLDLGTKTIGVAVSDTAQSIATPVETIQRTKFTKDIEALGALIKEFDIGGYIPGLAIEYGWVGGTTMRCHTLFCR